MSVTLKTPGVYIDEVSMLPSSIVRDAATIPLFLGYTNYHSQKFSFNIGTTMPTSSVLIRSAQEFAEVFGKAVPEKFLVTVTDTQAPNGPLVRNLSVTMDSGGPSKFILWYAIQHYFANGGGPCKVISISSFIADFNSSRFVAGIADSLKVDGCQLLVMPGASLVPTNYAEVVNKGMDSMQLAGNRFLLLDVPDSGNPSTDLAAFRGLIASGNVAHSAAYYPHLRTNIGYEYDLAQITVTHTLNGSPGAMNGRKVNTLKSGNGSDNGLYNEIIAKINAFKVTLPPSAAVAGQIVRTDRDRGVWKAPANVSLNAVSEPTVQLTQTEQDAFNVDAISGRSVNLIRTFPGRGNLIWGARTLDGNSNEWRYVPVRRLFTMAEAAIKRGSEWAVFEPNDANTWLRLKSMIENYLTSLWRDGALLGGKPQEAFYVRVGLGVTMTPQDILEGILRIEIGMAAVRPAEFIVLRVSQMMQQS